MRPAQLQSKQNHALPKPNAWLNLLRIGRIYQYTCVTFALDLMSPYPYYIYQQDVEHYTLLHGIMHAVI